jgi:hypothetical protein
VDGEGTERTGIMNLSISLARAGSVHRSGLKVSASGPNRSGERWMTQGFTLRTV